MSGNPHGMANILILDDDDALRLLMKQLCGMRGHEVWDFADGRKATPEFMLQQGIDLLITDLVMPEKEGFETIQDMRTAFPQLPIVVVSAGVQGEAGNYLEIAKHLGAQVSLQKPFEAKDFLTALKNLGF